MMSVAFIQVSRCLKLVGYTPKRHNLHKIPTKYNKVCGSNVQQCEKIFHNEHYDYISKKHHISFNSPVLRWKLSSPFGHLTLSFHLLLFGFL